MGGRRNVDGAVATECWTGKRQAIKFKFLADNRAVLVFVVLRLLLATLLFGTAGCVFATPLPTDMAAYYCVDDPTNLGKDCSANKNNGTVSGGVAVASGVLGGGALFGGLTKGYLDFATTRRSLGAGTGFWVNKP